MSINQGSGNGGLKIVPSARKSIHCHPQCPFANGEDMARYGDNSSDDEQPAAADVGVDEVDNVMSKFSHAWSPLAMMRRNSLTPPNLQYTDDSEEHKFFHASTPLAMTRRNSLTPPNLQYTDDSEEHDVLAKSLPATLPSRSYYSDDFDSRRVRSALSDRLNKSDSATPRSRGNRTGDSHNSSFATRSPNISHRINQSVQLNRELENKSSRGTICKSLAALLTVFCAAYYYDFFSSALESQQAKYDEVKFHNDLNELGTKYKVGDDSILQLQAGISTIFKREDTSCVVFLYNSMKNDFDRSNFDGFVNNVASNAAKFLRNDTTSVHHIVVEGSDLSMRSHTQLVKAYRKDVARTGVLLVRDVEHVPSALAMAFHYYCDEYNPLVKKSAIFFTLNTARCHNSGEKSSHASVERCLKEKWSAVPQDNIGPLLTRVVSIVVDVTSGI